jgi:hypothetical protein
MQVVVGPGNTLEKSFYRALKTVYREIHRVFEVTSGSPFSTGRTYRRAASRKSFKNIKADENGTMNVEKYPWLHDLHSNEAQIAIQHASLQFQETGAAIFLEFLTPSCLKSWVTDAASKEATAYTTCEKHTAY